MLDKIIHFVLHQRVLVMVGTLVLVVGGLLAWHRLPIDAFPDVTNVQVMVLTDAPGLAPADVEQRVTFPIELSMQGLPDVREVRSLSKAALSQVIVVFEDRVDTYFARQLVFQRLEAAKDRLPEWAEPEMGPISTGLGEIYQYTLESDTRSPMELRTLQDWVIAPQLRALQGVNEVNSFGGHVKQYQVLVDPDRLLQYGITLREVLAAVERNNANAGGNFLVQGWEQAYVRSVGLIQTIADIENIVLEAEDGTPVYIKDIATVQVGAQTRQGAVTRDGKGERTAGMVIMLKDENSKLVVDRVKKAIPRIQAGLPDDVRIDTFYDRTSLIQACINTVGGALLQGGIFVVIVLFLLLGNLRASLIVALSLPLTALTAFILMGWQNVTANLMSLGGLAVAIGMIVDASIVITENIVRHLAMPEKAGLPRSRIAAEAAHEVARPILFAILTIVVVFLPLFTLEQMEGKMFRPLALTVCFAMVGSLLVSLTVVPTLCSFFLPGRGIPKDPFLAGVLKRPYLRLLGVALRHKRVTVAVAAALLLVSLVLVPFIGTEFLPQLDEGAIAVNVVRLPSASLDGSVAVGTEIERRLLAAFPEVRTVVTKTGRAVISEDPMGPEQNDVFIMLHPEKAWRTGRDKAALVAAIQDVLGEIPGIRPAFSQPIALRVNELLSGVKSDVAVKLFGPELDRLRESANDVAAAISGVDGAEDVKVEQVSGFAQVEVVVDRNEIARHRINVDDINAIIETAVGGKVATTVVEGQKRFALLVRFPEAYRGSMDALERILVPSPAGARFPLGQLADIRRVEAPAQISREDGMRRVVVECNIRGRDMGGFVSDIKDAIAPIAHALPAGYFVDIGGQFENQQRAMARLAVVVPVAVLLIFLMLFLTFKSVRHALLVMMTLPFGLIGGVFAVLLLRINLSVPAIVGFIALFGATVQDGAVLVTFFNRFRQQGTPMAEMVREVCAMRFISVVMTSLTTLCGLLPMVYATGSGSEVQRPLAAVVLGGLLTSLFLTLVVLPVLYTLLEKDDVEE